MELLYGPFLGAMIENVTAVRNACYRYIPVDGKVFRRISFLV
jgi:hypothetical protein